jgi:hypothetical protein
MGDDFFGDGVYYSIAVFFDFNDRACILIMDKFARDGDGRDISKSQVNDVIQCLVWDIPGHPDADETMEPRVWLDGLVLVVGVLSCSPSGSSMGRGWVCCLV